ncbi:MAG TPA: GAF domain-containing protein [Ohtaekwangia sp.]|uniref:GAF domain-containing protein n=1 Tax=Ohtaekwangia sp. TaxID=2066019 RepID=UPI002F9509F2
MASDELQRASVAGVEYLSEVTPLLEEVEQHGISDYEWSITDNAIIQIILVILSVPILLIASSKLKAEIRNRNTLLIELEKTNRTYLYNSGVHDVDSVNTVITRSIENLQKACEFVEQVSKGDYTQAKHLISDEVRVLNESTLMGALLRMSLRLERAEGEEKIRTWSTEGLNDFYKIVRNNPDDLNQLANESIAFITKYLGSQQGGLFLLQDINGDAFLELAACYAFDRKKWITKRIDIGEGIIGQAFLEGQVTMMTDIPKDYISITSGLGHATPSCLLVVPLLFDEKVEGVIELAGFQKYEPYHIDFVRSAGEFLAAALQNTKSRLQIQNLLDQSNAQAEMLRAQEEELRQNLEELEATNEAMRRARMDTSSVK